MMPVLDMLLYRDVTRDFVGISCSPEAVLFKYR